VKKFAKKSGVSILKLLNIIGELTFELFDSEGVEIGFRMNV
jgi:hypothetical protein